jgi:hypothetical protein
MHHKLSFECACVVAMSSGTKASLTLGAISLLRPMTDGRAGGAAGRGGNGWRPDTSHNGSTTFEPMVQMCVFITAVPILKLFAWGEGDSGGHVLRETTSRGLCGLVCPSWHALVNAGEREIV